MKTFHLRAGLLPAALLLTVCLLLTGCIRVDSALEIKPNGNMDVEIVYAVRESDSLMNPFASAFSERFLSGFDPEELRAKGFTVADYAQDGYKGYLLTRNDLRPNEGKSELGGMYDFVYTREGRRCSLHVPLNGAQNDFSFDEIAAVASTITSYGGSVRFRIRLPVQPVSHNATSVSEDGKTLTWDLLNLGDRTSIDLTFEMDPVRAFLSATWWIFVLIGGILLLGLCVLIPVLVLRKKRRARAQAEPDTGEQIRRIREKSGEEESTQRTDPQTDPTVRLLRQYKQLLDDGVITEEEFEAKKKELLNAQSGSDDHGQYFS